MDRIVIQGLEVWAHHGVLDHERRLGQRFYVDVALELDLTEAGATDALGDTVDYAVLSERVVEAVAEPPANLLETVATRVLDVCFENERVTAAEVVIGKPSAPLSVPAAEVRVEMRRERR